MHLSLNASPVTLACCVAQLHAVSGMLLAPASAGGAADAADALGEALRVQDRQADVIAHLLAHNDELATSNDELRTANAALAAALDRHVAVVSALAEENAALLERDAHGVLP